MLALAVWPLKSEDKLEVTKAKIREIKPQGSCTK